MISYCYMETMKEKKNNHIHIRRDGSNEYPITKTRVFKYTENFTTKKKNENFQMKNSDIFLISPQDIDCGYSLEPPR